MPFHFAETNSNIVTLGAFDPISREPNFKQCAVRVERTSNSEIAVLQRSPELAAMTHFRQTHNPHGDHQTSWPTSKHSSNPDIRRPS